MSRITHARGASVRERHFHRDKRNPQINLGNYKLVDSAKSCIGPTKALARGMTIWSSDQPIGGYRLFCNVDTTVVDSNTTVPDAKPLLCTTANVPVGNEDSTFTLVCQEMNDALYPPPSNPVGLAFGIAIGGLAVASTVGAALAVYCAYKMYKRCTDPERENLITPEPVRQQRLFEPRVFTNPGAIN